MSPLLRALVYFLAATSSVFADATSAGPLATPEDALGRELQQAFIWAPAGARTESPFLAFRRGFALSTAPDSATLHLFADARYMLWINGRYVTGGP